MAEETNLSKLTPEELTEFFMNGLKTELGVYDLQANKVGFLGYLVNMLGNITYDSKIYKDMLFNEAFPATARQDDEKVLSSLKNNYFGKKIKRRAKFRAQKRSQIVYAFHEYAPDRHEILTDRINAFQDDRSLCLYLLDGEVCREYVHHLHTLFVGSGFFPLLGFLVVDVFGIRQTDKKFLGNEDRLSAFPIRDHIKISFGLILYFYMKNENKQFFTKANLCIFS